MGKNGVSALATELVQPLRAYQDDFSIVRGALMSAFDGHDQNAYFMLTGNPFGGDLLTAQFNPQHSYPWTRSSMRLRSV